jgi:hypothetical protein
VQHDLGVATLLCGAHQGLQNVLPHLGAVNRHAAYPAFARSVPEQPPGSQRTRRR